MKEKAIWPLVKINVDEFLVKRENKICQNIN